MFPLARHENLIVTETADETLVYDQETWKAHCLNRTASLVLKHCDGRTPVPELARILHQELGLPAEEAVVELALEQLARRHLLHEPAWPFAFAHRASRRDVLRKLGAAVATLPLIMTMTARPARAQASAAGSSNTPSTLAQFCVGLVCFPGVNGDAVCQTVGGNNCKCQNSGVSPGNCNIT